MRDVGADGPATTYFGNDLTDEDAFRALTQHRGVVVLVGKPRRSFAQYHVEGTSEVAALLEELVTIVQQ